MKKLLAAVITAALALTAFTAVCSAAPSPEKNEGVIASVTAKDKDNANVEVEVKNVSNDTAAFDSVIKDLQKDNSKLKVSDHKEISVKNNASANFPVTVEFKVTGVKDGTKAYILLKKADGTVTKLETTVSAGLVKGVFAEFGEFVLLTDVDNAGSGTSPKTGDVATTAMLAMLVLSAGAAFVSVKKIRA